MRKLPLMMLMVLPLAVVGLSRGEVSVATTQPATTQPATTQPATTQPAVPMVMIPKREIQRYQVLEDRNIFLRGSGARGRSTGNANGSSRTVYVGRRWTLTGTILRAANPVAFLESSESGSTLRLGPGQDTPMGKITQVGMDFILIQDAAQNSRRLEIGQSINLDEGLNSSGTPFTDTPSLRPTASHGESMPGNSGGGGTSGGGGDEAAVLERLRARRAQEVGR